MLQYSTYFVISPEGCANIIWKSSEFAPAAAAAMGVTSSKLEELGIVDATIPEPLGGAHRNPQEMAVRVKRHLLNQIDRLSSMDTEAMLEARYRRLMSYGN
jgi:acetyl-CoA carboxylase carboxyl transferase subunit alpha